MTLNTRLNKEQAKLDQIKEQKPKYESEIKRKTKLITN